MVTPAGVTMATCVAKLEVLPVRSTASRVEAVQAGHDRCLAAHPTITGSTVTA